MKYNLGRFTIAKLLELKGMGEKEKEDVGKTN